MFAILGIVLLVIGAIVTFAIDRQADGVDLQAIGYILMAGGALALIIAAVRGGSWMTMNKTAMRTERHMTDDGRHYVEETVVD